MFNVKICAHCSHEWINGSYCPMCGGPRKEEKNDKESQSVETKPKTPEFILCAGGCGEMVLIGSEHYLCDRCLDYLMQQQPSW